MAGGSSKSTDGKKKARIEIIPLIDVIFFLLATFVLFTLSLSRIVSVPLQLPETQINQTPPDPDMVTLQVTGAGAYYWNREPIDSEELIGRLRQLKNEIKEPKILITGDNQAHFGPTVYALDQIRLAGIEQVSIQTSSVSETGK
ncbi:MAG TPA: biopolymer transporter ExbD [Opitutaceae bacterium]|jgi:biopolymer transport protein ExbD